MKLPIDLTTELYDDMFEIVKAVAHIGIDFGYGKFELQDEHIAKAREICEQLEAIEEKS